MIRGFEVYCDVAVRAAKALRHEVKRAEDFPASPSTPQQACLAGVRWADAVILLIGSRYGSRQPSGLSATHEEYREARDRCQVLVLIQRGVDLEPAQQEFLREVQAWATGHLTASFSDAEELRDATTVALHDLELTRAVGPVDEAVMRRLAAKAAFEWFAKLRGASVVLGEDFDGVRRFVLDGVEAEPVCGLLADDRLLFGALTFPIPSHAAYVVAHPVDRVRVPWDETTRPWLEDRQRVTDAAKRVAGRKFTEATDTFYGETRPD